jgi:hypothetical protein
MDVPGCVFTELEGRPGTAGLMGISGLEGKYLSDFIR